jgi:hypothetical protein
MSKYIYIFSGCGRVVEGGGHKTKRLVLQCFSKILCFTKLYLKCRLIIKFTSTGAINAIPRSSSQTGRTLRNIHFSNGNECVPFYISRSGSALPYNHISNENGSFTFYVDFFLSSVTAKNFTDLTVYMSCTVSVL